MHTQIQPLTSICPDVLQSYLLVTVFHVGMPTLGTSSLTVGSLVMVAAWPVMIICLSPPSVSKPGPRMGYTCCKLAIQSVETCVTFHAAIKCNQMCMALGCAETHLSRNERYGRIAFTKRRVRNIVVNNLYEGCKAVSRNFEQLRAYIVHTVTCTHTLVYTHTHTHINMHIHFAYTCMNIHFTVYNKMHTYMLMNNSPE
jgi:hypothetical protein